MLQIIIIRVVIELKQKWSRHNIKVLKFKILKIIQINIFKKKKMKPSYNKFN